MSQNVPDAMQAELRKWNGGRGISVAHWIDCVGTRDLAVAYSTVFWPTFEVVGKYILAEGWTHENIRDWERAPGSIPAAIEWALNHRHLVDIPGLLGQEPTVEHALFLGRILKDVHAAKLIWQFPDRPCVVEFHIPEDREDIMDYEISFWQRKWGRNRDNPTDTAPVPPPTDIPCD